MVKVHRHCPTILSANLLQRRIEVAAHGGCFCNKNPYRLLKSRLGQPVITNERLRQLPQLRKSSELSLPKR